jgi:hypothetical protein
VEQELPTLPEHMSSPLVLIGVRVTRALVLCVCFVDRWLSFNTYLYSDEEQTTQWSKEKVLKDNQRSTKHTHKTKARVTRTPINTRGELMCSGRVGH